ncbi:sensor histidine kinase [Symbiobacterium thermophilum]|uniref:histidine kinase n=1 Tax=Symbiobacterium thermophilum (strain DSM 24528 / JCM 14929 / IAM 14863 / T) TaxID=292459 RepID=Q67JF5_SYMTH|nr:sensor histidine kinase [Symbiobacterium thermophilum]BAD42195.1 two-component sensor histidine kinase [Symbiobacterium thermophilum IAM 14863]
MRFWQFLWDRINYIAVYVAFAALSLVVVHLDLMLTGASLQVVNLLYIFLLGLVGLVVYLWWEYQRIVPFYRHLAGLTGREPIAQLALLPVPQTAEGELLAEAWSRMYGRLSGELAAERERGQRNVSLVTQWAHHMKTPVAVIDLLLQRADTEEWPEEARALAAGVAEENQRLQHSLQMLLNTVRLQDFAQDFRAERLDLLALVREVINDEKRAFIARRVYPQVVAEDEGDRPWLVESDAKWLRLVLEQVVSNALKYASRPPEADEQGRVLFRLRREGGDVVLEIADNGVGIPPEDLGRVFDPFFTGLNGRAFPQATGMGLYLAREVCSQLGHGISLDSAPGEGTTVRLRFAAPQTLFAGLRDSLTANVTEP